MTSDLMSLIIQFTGGPIASIANTQSQTNLGVNVIIAGLISQA
jgi:hypothetical protein